MESKAIILLALLSVIIISGCTQGKIDTSQLIVCEKPYIRFAAGCCLDQNQNSICDNDETSTTISAESGTGTTISSGSSSEATTTTMPSSESPVTDTTISDSSSNTSANASVNTTCDPGYTFFNGSCCVDENYNRICDNKENMTIMTGINMTVYLPRPFCGDGNCYITENSTNCPSDCGCPVGYALYNNSCTSFKYYGRDYSLMEFCGNGVCKNGTENQTTCCKDCGCPPGKVCSSSTKNCTTISILPPSLSPMIFFYDTYIVVTIDSIVVNDDTDPAGPGELMLFTYAGSGDTVQKLNWPYRIWYEASSGSTIAKRIPIFSMKESDMGDNLAISVTAIDNDQMPGWLETIIDILTAPVRLILIVTETVGKSVSELELQLGADAAAGLSDVMYGNEKIGTVNKVYLKNQSWGVSSSQYTVRSGGLTLSYSISRVTVPRNSKLGLRVYNVTLSDTGDYYDGEVFMYVRGAANYGQQDLTGSVYRLPEHGTWDLGDNAFIHSGACTPDLTGCPENPIFSIEENGPFIFVELDAWDEDEPDVGDDHDSLGTLSYTYLYSDFDLPPVTVATTYADRVDYPWIISGNTTKVPILTRGNMKVFYEFYRKK